MRIWVYGAASPTIDKEYIRLVEEMGKTDTVFNRAVLENEQ